MVTLIDKTIIVLEVEVMKKYKRKRYSCTPKITALHTPPWAKKEILRI